MTTLSMELAGWLRWLRNRQKFRRTTNAGIQIMALLSAMMGLTPLFPASVSVLNAQTSEGGDAC